MNLTLEHPCNTQPIPQEFHNQDQQNLIKRNTCFGVDELKCYRKNPLYAQHMLWDTSGISRFEFGDTEIRDKPALLSEIMECAVTEETIARCIRNYKMSMDYANMAIHHCAVCGRLIMHELQGNTKRPTIALQRLSILQLPINTYNEWNAKGRLKVLYNVFVSDESLRRAYYLIPELVYEDESNNSHYIHACEYCTEAVLKKSKLPKYSIGNNIYFFLPL
jgi:hypothetical protein